MTFITLYFLLSAIFMGDVYWWERIYKTKFTFAIVGILATLFIYYVWPLYDGKSRDLTVGAAIMLAAIIGDILINEKGLFSLPSGKKFPSIIELFRKANKWLE